MPLNIASEMEAVCEGIRAQGVPAVIDERDANPPCVLVQPPELSFRFGQGRFDATWTALVMVPNAGKNVALGQLGELIELAAKGIRAAVLAGQPADVQLPDNAAPVPGYSINWSSKIIV